MEYRTRALIAQQDLVHSGVYVRKDTTFSASQVDADYYVSKGKAVDVPAPPSEPPPAQGRPIRTRAAATRAVEPAPLTTTTTAEETRSEEPTGDTGQADSAT